MDVSARAGRRTAEEQDTLVRHRRLLKEHVFLLKQKVAASSATMLRHKLLKTLDDELNHLVKGRLRDDFARVRTFLQQKELALSRDILALRSVQKNKILEAVDEMEKGVSREERLIERGEAVLQKGDGYLLESVDVANLIKRLRRANERGDAERKMLVEEYASVSKVRPRKIDAVIRAIQRIVVAPDTEDEAESKRRADGSRGGKGSSGGGGGDGGDGADDDLLGDVAGGVRGGGGGGMRGAGPPLDTELLNFADTSALALRHVDAHWKKLPRGTVTPADDESGRELLSTGEGLRVLVREMCTSLYITQSNVGNYVSILFSKYPKVPNIGQLKDDVEDVVENVFYTSSENPEKVYNELRTRLRHLSITSRDLADMRVVAVAWSMWVERALDTAIRAAKSKWVVKEEEPKVVFTA